MCRMISASRFSVCEKLHESREAFCCISSALVATPPALAALPGPNATPASWKICTASGVVGMFAPSATALTPLRTRATASSSASSFCVAQGSATSQGTAHTLLSATNLALATALGVLEDPGPLDFLDLLEQFDVEALLVDDVTARVRAGDHGRAQLLRLLRRVDRDVARTGDHDALPVQTLAAGAQHLRGEEHAAVAGGLRTALRAAPVHALAGQHARLVAVGDALVLTEQVADLARPDADVAGRYVGVLTEVPVELRHERLAEAHDFGVRAVLGVEVAAALAAADVAVPSARS